MPRHARIPVGPHVRVLRPVRGLEFDLRELRAERELLRFLAARNIQVRYKQALAGPGWAVFQPVVGMVLFTAIFGGLAKLPSDGVPYPVFYLSAFLIWTYFANTLGAGANAVVDNAALVSKVYFPRIFLPLSYSISGLVDLAVASAVAVPLLLVFGADLGPGALLVVVPTLVAVLAGSGLALILSSLNAHYRDVRFVVPFFIQAGLFGSPVAYSTSIVPDGYHEIFALNPMVGAIEGFRWCLAGSSPITPTMFAISAAVAAAMFILGVIVFQRLDATLADVV